MFELLHVMLYLAMYSLPEATDPARFVEFWAVSTVLSNTWVARFGGSRFQVGLVEVFQGSEACSYQEVFEILRPPVCH